MVMGNEYIGKGKVEEVIGYGLYEYMPEENGQDHRTLIYMFDTETDAQEVLDAFERVNINFAVYGIEKVTRVNEQV